MTQASSIDGAALHSLRHRRGENQTTFWSRVGVDQAVGSRYERGTLVMPAQVQMLVGHVYGNQPIPRMCDEREQVAA